MITDNLTLTSPAGLRDDHFRAELVELVPEIFRLQVADHVPQLLAIRALLQQRIHRRDALSARAASIVCFRLVLRIDRLRNRRSAPRHPRAAGFPFCNEKFSRKNVQRLISIVKYENDRGKRLTSFGLHITLIFTSI